MIEMLLGGSLPPPPGGSIKKFQVGAVAIGALTPGGNLYTIGDMYSSGSGVATTTWGLVATGIEDFWMGYRTNLLKTKDGRWLFMGSNQYLPTSLPETINTPTDISSSFVIPDGYVVKSIVVSFRSLCVVFTNGRYAMMGVAPATVGDVRTLTVFDDFTDVVKAEVDQTSGDTVYLMRSDGSVYGRGSSSYGQLGQTTGVTTWKSLTTQAQASQVRDIVAGIQGVFFIRETDTGYGIYSQGRQFDGSIGTGQTSDASITTMTLVATVPSKAGGPPTLYVGRYSARYQDPNTKAIYYTGTGNGNMSGGGASFSGAKYAFTQMPVGTLWGEYKATTQSYTAAYIFKDGVVYGSGVASALGLLPGLTGTVLTFTPIDTSPAV